jgi:hypothetical protein
MKRKGLLLILVVIPAAGAVVWALAARRKEKPLVLSGSIEARDVEA